MMISKPPLNPDNNPIAQFGYIVKLSMQLENPIIFLGEITDKKTNESFYSYTTARPISSEYPVQGMELITELNRNEQYKIFGPATLPTSSSGDTNTNELDLFYNNKLFFKSVGLTYLFYNNKSFFDSGGLNYILGEVSREKQKSCCLFLNNGEQMGSVMNTYSYVFPIFRQRELLV